MLENTWIELRLSDKKIYIKELHAIEVNTKSVEVDNDSNLNYTAEFLLIKFKLQKYPYCKVQNIINFWMNVISS